MKSLITLTLLLGAGAASANICTVDMVDSYRRTIRTYTSYDAPNCMEAMRDCRKEIRLEPGLGGVDCLRVTANPDPRPNPYPTPTPTPTPTPVPNPTPIPQPNPNPLPGNLPTEVYQMGPIEQAAAYTLNGCHVLMNVEGWANQLYVNGQFAGNFKSGSEDARLSAEIRRRQYDGLCTLKRASVLQLQFSPTLIQEAVDRTLSRNCYVKPKVEGWADQLYVNGQFSGNYSSNYYDQMKLRAALASGLDSGTCIRRTYEELQIMNNPYLIQDFIEHRYRNCYVLPNVSGWANQLYVNGQFSGNFHKNTEVTQLKVVLAEKVMNGTCRARY